MKNYKQYIFAGLTLLSLSLTSCDDFLDTAPNDALTPSKTWKTESDVNKFLTGCYDFFQPAISLVYWDAGSDFGYNNFPWEGFTCIGNGTMTPSNPGARPDPAWRGGYMDLYDFQTIRRCNTLLANVDKATFSSEAVKKDMVAQCRFIRAYRYFVMTNRYGGVPIIDNYSTAQEAQVPRSSEADVHKYIKDELAAVIADINTVPTQRGRAGKGAALALKMRLALYESDWATAKDAAQAIINLGQYSLESNYATLFQVAGQDSKEIILASQQESNNYAYDWSFYFPNSVGGWSSVVPTQQCVDNYEMANGMTIDESGSGYDPTHPYHGRDPRLSATIIYPGCDWNGSVYNSLDQFLNGAKNPDYSATGDNATKTAYNWRKYADPFNQYPSMGKANVCPIIFRYAEVLLTWAEAENELNGPSAQVYEKIDQVRQRAGMPAVDRTKYNTKETLRELIHRERGSEFAGEGIRRWDILRWKTADGKMYAHKVLNVTLTSIVGTLSDSPTKDSADPTMRATIDPSRTEKIEERTFQDFNRYLPIPQSARDKNPNLSQNPGYDGAK